MAPTCAHDRKVGPSTSSIIPQEDNQNLYGDKMEGLYSTAQQLLTYQMRNEYYSAILLTYSKDVEDIRDKVVDEEGGSNPDKWLDEADKVTMSDALRYL